VCVEVWGGSTIDFRGTSHQTLTRLFHAGSTVFVEMVLACNWMRTIRADFSLVVDLTPTLAVYLSGARGPSACSTHMVDGGQRRHMRRDPG
jgi:hypothetical protein